MPHNEKGADKREKPRCQTHRILGHAIVETSRLPSPEPSKNYPNIDEQARLEFSLEQIKMLRSLRLLSIVQQRLYQYTFYSWLA